MKNRHFFVMKALFLFLITGTTLLFHCGKKHDVPKAEWKPANGPLLTKWAKDISALNAHPEYPRPQMVRQEWQNLNGLWDVAILPKERPSPDKFNSRILVPFPVESALSGVGKAVGENHRLWYRRFFKIEKEWRDRHILLHFGAVDWETTVWVNGEKIGSHRGGYDPFTFDITRAIRKSDVQEIIVSVWDPVDSGTQPRGKQVKKPRGIWYTSVTGIWQTVWVEPVNESYFKSIKIVPDSDKKVVVITPFCSNVRDDFSVQARVMNEGKVEGMFTARINAPVSISINNPRLWSPDSPFLYDLNVTLLNDKKEKVDEVDSYFGMRKISLGKDEKGITRLLLNNEFVFQFGPLDQGWWPDGLYTAPTDEALKYDIQVTKRLGFNMARKHVKIEPQRWYYWCDKLGLLVWQDMPSGDKYIGRNDRDITRSPESARQFELELERMINNLGNHPGIIVWVPFNEGWGQYDTLRIVELIKSLDATRLVINASGWADRKVGDIHDIHAYPGPAMPEPEDNRAVVLGEFGGLGLPIRGHTWQDKDNWGYRNYTDPGELTLAYTDLIKKLLPLKTRGLSAAVYTQTTDVEIEVNGLMTYDRAVIKMKPEEAAGINRAMFEQ